MLDRVRTGGGNGGGQFPSRRGGDGGEGQILLGDINPFQKGA